MKKLFFIMMISALLIGAVGFSVGAFGWGNSQNQPGSMGCFLDGTLKLTAEQQQKILAIRQDFQKETLILRQNMQQKMLELRQLWSSQPLNQTLIETKTKEVTAIRVQLTEKTRAIQEKCQKILTTEQLKELETKRKESAEKGKGQQKGFRGQGCGKGSGFSCGGGLSW